MKKADRVKQIFEEVVNRDTDWSLSADLFVRWNVDRNFQTESFSNFVDWIADHQIDEVWTFFFGYGEDFEKFASDWVDEEEVSEYLAYCLGE